MQYHLNYNNYHTKSMITIIFQFKMMLSCVEHWKVCLQYAHDDQKPTAQYIFKINNYLLTLSMCLDI